MAFGNEAPGKVNPAHTRHGGVNPMSATFVIGAVPKNGSTYAVSGLSAFARTVTVSSANRPKNLFFIQLPELKRHDLDLRDKICAPFRFRLAHFSTFDI